MCYVNTWTSDRDVRWKLMSSGEQHVGTSLPLGGPWKLSAPTGNLGMIPGENASREKSHKRETLFAFGANEKDHRSGGRAVVEGVALNFFGV